MNRLANERSAYLRKASNQMIDWYPWSEEAFEKARSEDKPVFLSSGAVWCHWCHVMAKESFENEEVAAILTEKFICIKLDRDERPDVDRRYQQAVSAMGSGSGWPLSVFLTPEKKPFYGGTYFPPAEMHGRPSFIKVLNTVSDFYRNNREKIDEQAEKVVSFLREAPSTTADIDKKDIDHAISKILAAHDNKNGGFGTSPKFHMSGALELLINKFYFTCNDTILNAVRRTLYAMASGGFRDHLGGGFHRYSVDDAWKVPHFEKMANDNAWLLRIYLDAYAVIRDPHYREVAEGTIGFLIDVLSDPEGGFYSSQDADVTPDDEGGYFTWTLDDLRECLDEAEYEVILDHLVSEEVSMHHNAAKKVLSVNMSAEEIAWKRGEDISAIKRMIRNAKKKMLRCRDKRETPFIDRTFYTSLNGLLINSFIRAYRTFGEEHCRDFAIKSLKRILKMHYVDGELLHTEGVKGFLDHYIFIVEALLSAYEMTAERTYLLLSEELMNLCLKRLWDDETHGLHDTDDRLLGITVKAIEDTPQPSANSVAIRLFVRLYHMTGKERYMKLADEALMAFSESARGMGLFSAGYYTALDSFYNTLRLTVQSAGGSDFINELLSIYIPYSVINYEEGEGGIIPCTGETCYEPVKGIEELKGFLENNNCRI
jgi:uncharacterized protein YyaL (SSP411 family)